MLRTGAINLVLKVGLMLSSVVFAIMSFVQGSTIIQYYPDFIINLIGESATLILGSLIALCLALWLLSRRQRFAAVATYLVFLTVGILFNLTSLSYLSTVWPLWCISFALSLRYYPRIRVLAKDNHGRYVMKIIPAATAAIIASDEDLDSKDSSKSNSKNTKIGGTVAHASTQTTQDTQVDIPTTLNTSTPAFREEDEKSDIANKHSTNTALDYEITHDVDATIEEIFSHAGLLQTDSTKDELQDDVVGEMYSPIASPFTETTNLGNSEATNLAEPSVQPAQPAQFDVIEPKSIKRPRISRITKKTVTEDARVPRLTKSIAKPIPPEEPIVPLSEVVSIEENPRIAKKRAKAKSVPRSRVKKTTDTTAPTSEYDIEDIQ